MPLFAQTVRRHAELLAEGTGESLVRAVARIEGNLENGRWAVDQRKGGPAQAPTPDIAADRMAGGKPKDARQMIARQASRIGDLV